MRQTGLDIIGPAAWGTHFCQFYRTTDDLADILVPYFKAGLENNEFCMWVTSPPFEEGRATEALRQKLPDLERYQKEGRIEILPYSAWYLAGGEFDSQRVLKGWVEKLQAALDRGLEGLRLTGNTFWLEEKDWRSFTDYEEEVNNIIGRYPMLALCTYSLEKCGASEILDVIRNHQFALMKSEKGWDIIESSSMRSVREKQRESEQQYETLFNSLGEGFALHEIICDEAGVPCDYRFLDVNPAFEQQTGLARAVVRGKRVTDVLPGIEQHWIQTYGEVALTGKARHFENRSEALGKDFEVIAYSPRHGQFAVLFLDVTERKRTEEEVRRTAQELERSNHDLEQFAYVASHDLQEPLRAVSGYVELLQRRYQNHLDETALRYISGASDGTLRMQKLITDLLAFSRVGTRAGVFEPTDLNRLLDEVLQDLCPGIMEAGAVVTRDPLPILPVDPTQFAQLFQNLIGNALKFRSEKPPEIHVGARHEPHGWCFSVCDNGIGIDPQYQDRIFLIFQRLHTRRQYPGTGIGLAICKRIVERHGGKMWVESQVDRGATFYFTFPD
ncbi:MAG: PAS domain S-box protein [Acidobacteria bacterium]|nr:MAG: PAS domain S-box protein [Acidobacteriota bacterium]